MRRRTARLWRHVLGFYGGRLRGPGDDSLATPLGRRALACALVVTGFVEEESPVMQGVVRNLLSDEDGATAVEYVIIAGLIAVVVIATLNFFGAFLSDTYDSSADQIESATS